MYLYLPDSLHCAHPARNSALCICSTLITNIFTLLEPQLPLLLGFHSGSFGSVVCFARLLHFWYQVLSSLSRQKEKQPPQSQGSIPFADSSARAPSTRRTSPLHRNKVYPSNGSLGCKYFSILASFWCNSSLPIPTTFHLFILCAGTQPLQYDLTLKLPSSSSLPLPSTLYSDPEHPVNLTNSSTQRSFLHPAVSTYTKEWLKIRSYPTESSASNLAFFRFFFFFLFC